QTCALPISGREKTARPSASTGRTFLPPVVNVQGDGPPTAKRRGSWPRRRTETVGPCADQCSRGALAQDRYGSRGGSEASASAGSCPGAKLTYRDPPTSVMLATPRDPSGSG